MNFKTMMEERAKRKLTRDALYAQADALSDPAPDPMLQYTLDSGTRCTIGGLLGKRLDITCAGGNPWAEEEGVKFLTLGMLSVEDLREFLEIRLVIEAWRAGDLDGLPTQAVPFERWRCPHGFEVPIIGGEL